MPLTAESRIVAAEEQLTPLAEVLADEIATLTSLRLRVTTAPARAGDIVLRIDKALVADEQILVLRNREPARTTDGAHTVTIDTKSARLRGQARRGVARGTPGKAGLFQRAARERPGTSLRAARATRSTLPPRILRMSASEWPR